MEKSSYEGCQNCLVRACCQNVCKEYRQHVRETKSFDIMIDPLSLKESEEMIAISYTESEWEFKTDDGINYSIKLNMGIKGVV